VNTKKLFATVAAASIALASVALVSSPAQALETYTSVATASSQTFADGTTASASFANNGAYVAGGFNGQSTLGYKITADDNSSVTITFSSSQSGWT
jgi:FtsP/CotA-like multicopper oxidase with cupredoxin domain